LVLGEGAGIDDGQSCQRREERKADHGFLYLAKTDGDECTNYTFKKRVQGLIVSLESHKKY
jgi:hypothetical protein